MMSWRLVFTFVFYAHLPTINTSSSYRIPGGNLAKKLSGCCNAKESHMMRGWRGCWRPKPKDNDPRAHHFPPGPRNKNSVILCSFFSIFFFSLIYYFVFFYLRPEKITMLSFGTGFIFIYFLLLFSV